VILAASCKGGGGKSTVALNTALALSELGHRVALLDADIYGPSIPMMTATLDSRAVSVQDGDILPVPAYGIETLSIGHMVERDRALLWQGPMVGQAIERIMQKALWSPADYLIIDTPPGTGDELMTLWESCKIDGVILVTSPQAVAVADVVRNFALFKRMGVPILGIVQNFDGYVCSCCKKVTRVFPGAGGRDLAKAHGVEFLASLPIDPEVAKAADGGFPLVLAKPDCATARAFRTIARRIATKCPKVPETAAQEGE